MAVTAGSVEDTAYSLMVPLVIRIWVAFVPPGTRGCNLNRRYLRVGIHRETTGLLAILRDKSPEFFGAYMEGGSQPLLAQIIVEQLMKFGDMLPKTSRPSPEQNVVIAAVLRAVIDELDRVNRSR